MNKEAKKKGKGKPRNKHDLGYKQLLSFIEMFRQLIQGYTDEDWKEKLDYSRAQRVDKEYVLPDFKKKESDILYKVPLLDEEKEVFLFLLIEHQSTVDHSISFRLLFYLAHVWYDIYKNMTQNEQRAESFSLPPVFPIVLYNGNEPWTVKDTLRDIVQSGELFGDFLPSLRYHLVDISKQEELEKQANALAAVFLLEKENPNANLEETIKKAISWAENESNYELWKTFMKWVARFLQDHRNPSNKDILDDLDFENKNKEEITTMIETLPQRLIDQGAKTGYVKGHEKGLKEGLEKGLVKGEVLGLLKWSNIQHPGIMEKYKDRVQSAQTEVEIQSIEKEILQDIESRKNS